MDLIDRLDVGEINGLVDARRYHSSRKGARTVYWNEPGLKVTRLRLISDPGFPLWDVSYCHGIINDEPVDVQLPFLQLPKKSMKSKIVEYARADRVYVKGIGILENISTMC